MPDPTERLLKLLGLLQSSGGLSGLELARRLEVDVRTVRRDIDRLRNMDYVIDASAGSPGYQLRGGTSLPPLLLTDDEAIALSVGLLLAVGTSVADIADTASRAVAKLEQLLPSRLRSQAADLINATETVIERRPTIPRQALTGLSAAIRDHRRIRFDYRSHGSTVLERREAEPYRLVHARSNWYLLGWDLDREDWRTYRVDRITPRTLRGQIFTPRPHPDAARSVALGIAAAPYRVQGVVLLECAAADAAELVGSAGMLEPADEHSTYFHAGADSIADLAAHIASLGVPFGAIDPPELRRALAEMGARIQQSLNSPTETS